MDRETSIASEQSARWTQFCSEVQRITENQIIMREVALVTLSAAFIFVRQHDIYCK